MVSKSLMSCAVLLFSCLHTGAQAQSGYVMTTLKPAATAKPGGQAMLDSKNRATGVLGYYAGSDVYAYFFTKSTQGSYTDYVSRWPASTSATLTPSKLYSQTARLLGMSPDGNKLLLSTGTSSLIYDTVAAKPVSVPPLDSVSAATCASAVASVLQVNDTGWIAGRCALPQEAGAATNAPLRSRAVRWLPGKPGQMLPLGPEFSSSTASYINAKGVVAGTVTERDTGLEHVAIWATDGLPTVWANEPDVASFPAGIDDAGRVLIRRFRSGESAPSYAIADNGAMRAITSSLPDVSALNVQGISPNGVVLGMGVSSTRGVRAFIWRDGTFTDLTDLVRSKGVSMPAGAFLSNVWSMNAQGSFMANYILSETAATSAMVRFTAKP